MWFIVDTYSRMIVGGRVAAHMKTEVVLDAGSQFALIRYGERLAEIDAFPPLGRSGTASITPLRKP